MAGGSLRNMMEFAPFGILSTDKFIPGKFVGRQVIFLYYYFFFFHRWGSSIPIPHSIEDVMPVDMWIDGEVLLCTKDSISLKS